MAAGRHTAGPVLCQKRGPAVFVPRCICILRKPLSVKFFGVCNDLVIWCVDISVCSANVFFIKSGSRKSVLKFGAYIEQKRWGKGTPWYKMSLYYVS